MPQLSQAVQDKVLQLYSVPSSFGEWKAFILPHSSRSSSERRVDGDTAIAACTPILFQRSLILLRTLANGMQPAHEQFTTTRASCGTHRHHNLHLHPSRKISSHRRVTLWELAVGEARCGRCSMERAGGFSLSASPTGSNISGESFSHSAYTLTHTRTC